MPDHLCHAMGCTVPVPPKLLMCRKHWYSVPPGLRRSVLDTYQPGQEITKTPTTEYVRAAMAAIRAVAIKEGIITDVSLNAAIARGEL